MNFKTAFQNDFSNLDLFQFVNNVNERTRLTLSYISLLLASTMLSTLGLLMENIPVVIGGMIISPLMWPLIKTSLGVCYERLEYIRQALELLFLSIIFSIGSGIIITYISPLQFLNNTIINLANPTLLDLIIALVAGAVASVSLIQPKINDSLAGVAIATSLMPPLCNVGISIALGRPDLALNSLTLFIVHVISIIFIAIVIFGSAGLRSKAKTSIIKQRTLILLTVILTLLSIPLFIYMRNYALSTSSISVVQEVLEEDLGSISTQFSVSDIKTEIRRSEDSEILAVNATVVLPEGIDVDYRTQQDIVKKLTEKLERDVDLSMVITRTISVVTDSDRVNQVTRQQITEYIQQFVAGFSDQSVVIETLNIEHQEGTDTPWSTILKVSADPSIQFTESQRDNLENELEFITGEDIQLDITLFPRINLISEEMVSAEEEYLNNIKNSVIDTVTRVNENIVVDRIYIETNNPENGLLITLDLTVPESVNFDRFDVRAIAEAAEQQLEGVNNSARLEINVVESRLIVTNLKVNAPSGTEVFEEELLVEDSE
jgi:uncharacterized hydrophobic protein (TIGR00271 family)